VTINDIAGLLGTAAAILGPVIGFIVWLVRLEGKASANKREIEVVAVDLGKTDKKVDGIELQVDDLRKSVATKEDLREVEGRVTKAVDDVGNRVATEIGNLVTVMGKPDVAPRTRTTKPRA